MDFTSPDTIRELAAEYDTLVLSPQHDYQSWCKRLTALFEDVARAPVDVRASLEFQRRIWNEDVVAAPGQGTVNVDDLLANEEFRRWLAERSVEPLPQGDEDRREALRRLYDELVKRVSASTRRTPWLKIFRVLASFYPRFFTTIADRSKLQEVHRALVGTGTPDDVGRHEAVLHRLEQVLGPAPDDLARWVVRMTLPWRLYEVVAEARVRTQPAPPTPPTGAEDLVPLPAARRRRGMTAMKGSYDRVIRILDYVGDGVRRDDLHAFLKQDNPKLKEGSIDINVNILMSELGVLERSGEELVPTQRGRDLLEKDDPSVLARWLVTRILGVDHALAYLRDHGPTPRRELQTVLQSVNPGWTSQFAPQAILSWLRSFRAIETDVSQRIALTPRGNEWAALIHWQPEKLTRDEEPEPEDVAEPLTSAEEAHGLAIPALKQLLARFPPDLKFSPQQVATLHAGLWSHPRRHFAILTGLSGSGKTSLAHAYAEAITAERSDSDDAIIRPLNVAVSPGWTDPSVLLGYVNPLRPGQYVSTEFVRYLVSCAAHPTRIHVAVLDEMNLSHPEQYLAPLLSGMEVDAPIVLHHEGTEIDGIPERLHRYPPNLVVIGTVNMDETTHGLSDKVLDRAVTLEFWDIDLNTYPRWDTREIPQAHEARARRVLSELMDALAPVRLHFGWRVVDDVLEFLRRAGADGVLDDGEALDAIVYSKIVPKLRGFDSPAFRSAFEQCHVRLKEHGLARSHAKVGELMRDLQETGSARFWR